MDSLMTSDFVRDSIGGFVRHSLTTLAGSLVADGVIMGNQSNDLIGSGMFLFVVGWSLFRKWKQRQALQAATAQIGKVN